MADIQIHRFGPKTDGDGTMKDILGGKGAGLADMCLLGIPVPPGFTIPCSVSVEYNQIVSSKVMPAFTAKLTDEVMSGLSYLIKTMGYTPLMSVRSGARVSMPGMMDTILNVGLTSKTLPEWEKRIGKRAALDSYRRLIQMYGSVALDIRMEKFEALLTEARDKAGVKIDSELPESALSRLVGKYLDLVQTETGKPFPDTVNDQVMGAVFAVFDSWNNPRAQEYRKINNIPFEWGTAATVQTMVFGNMDDKSCTGVLFTRNPSTGVSIMTGEWLANAQGEDVVAGIRTPEPFDSLGDWNADVCKQLLTHSLKLEDHYRDMQDIEFTVQSGKLYLLQTRTAKRSALAAFRVAQDMCLAGKITAEEALSRVTREQLFSAMSDTIDPKFKTAPHLTGIAAGGGVVTGVAVFTSDDAVNCTEPCILVTKETDPDDIAGMAKAVGILTATGGLTSHAAVVARGMNKACVVGATDLVLSGTIVKAANANGKTISNGSKITIDGATGRVWFSIDVPVIAGGASDSVSTILGWYCDSNQIAERIELHGGMTEVEISKAVLFARSKRVHIDLAALEYGIESNTYAKAEYHKRVDWLVVALQNCPAEDIIIDVRPLQSYLDPFDLGIFHMSGVPFGVPGAPNFQTWPAPLVKRTTLTGVPFSPNTKLMLQAAGFKLSGVVVKTFADLALASGSVDVSQEVIDNVFGGHEGYQAVLSMIEKTSGKKFTTMKPPAYWYDALQGT